MKQIEVHLNETSLATRKLPARSYLSHEHMWERNPAHEFKNGGVHPEQFEPATNHEQVDIRRNSAENNSALDDQIVDEINEALSKDCDDWEDEEADESGIDAYKSD